VTLVELLIAVALAVSVLAGVFTAIRPAQLSFAAQQEAVDLQQRLRIAVETVTRDLRMAASVRPYRAGAIDDGVPPDVLFRPDAITIHFPALTTGDARRIYFLRADAEGSRLMQSDGAAGAFPFLDDVVAVRFEYFGDPEPPREIAAADPVPADDSVAVTYGPAPPALTADAPGDGWGPGENCTFTVVAGQRRPRLSALGGPDFVVLDETLLSNGPWCPDAGHPERFDADLLRVRRVRVHLRLQAIAVFRGPAGMFFTHAGTATDPGRFVPDQSIRFDVGLRNWHAP
jgi:hypothetical protein